MALIHAVLRSAVAGLIDLAFPPCCITCKNIIKDDGSALFCPECLARLILIRPPLCPVCGIPCEGGGTNHLCGNCLLEPPPYETARAMGQYESVLLDAIHLFKYHGRFAVGEALGDMMAKFRYEEFTIESDMLVMPVPLHTRRLRERGFNQSMVLSRRIARAHRLDIDFASLQRKRDTEPQVRLDRKARKENISGVFELVRQKNIQGRRILLVDDVYTTGSTVSECAKSLIREGAASVNVLTAARAV